MERSLLENKQDLKTRDKLYERYVLIYYWAFGLFSVANLIDKTTIEYLGPVSTATFQDIISVFVLLLLFFKLLIQTYSYKSLALLLVVGFVIAASVFASGSKALMWIFLFAAASQGIDIKQVAKISFIVCVVVLFLTVVFYAVGLIEGRYLDDGSRSSLGFAHPNRLGTIVLTVCVSVVIIFKKKISFSILVGFLGAAAFVWFVSESRTAVVAIGLVLVVGFFVKHGISAKVWRYFCFGMLFGVIVAAFGSFFFMASYDSSDLLQQELNRTVSGRMYWAHYYFETYGISLFGQDYTNATIFFAGSEDYPSTFLVDNAYVRLLLGYGLIPTILLLFSLVWLFVKAFRGGLPNVVISLLFIFCVVGVMESSMIDLAMNYCLILIGMLFYSKWKPNQGDLTQ